MSFMIFDESFYLQHNPDVKKAVESGNFSSGFNHFIQFGLKEKRVNVSPFYDEKFYLQTYPAIYPQVQDGYFVSGLEHFIAFGESEGYSPSSLFDTEKYLRRYPDVATAVKAGIFGSALEHFLRFGQTEGREGNTFVESVYRDAYPDIDQAIQAGIIKSGLEHYLLYGQSENRTAIFRGDSGVNDIVTGFGKDARIYGISVGSYHSPLGDYQQINNAYWSTGDSQANEVDVLIGSPEKDTFYLGFVTNRKMPYGKALYDKKGEEDYTLIENFQVEKDRLALVGNPSNYQFISEDGNLNVYLISDYSKQPVNPPELIAILSGINFSENILNNLTFLNSTLVRFI